MAAVACSKKEAAETASESSVTISEQKPADSAAGAETSSAATPEAEGKALVEGADCLSCHKMDAKLVGPSYQDIAEKYTAGDKDALAQKIIEGSKGVWGDIPMTPHPGLEKESAKKMVAYILSLKK